MMTFCKAPRIISIATLLLTLLAVSSTMVSAQSVKLEGVIKGRSGPKIILQTADSPKVIVLLTDSTDVAQVVGALKEQQEALSEQAKKVAANKAAIAAATARFGQLNDYYILDEVTVYFGNGKIKVDPKYNPQLVALAEKAKSVNGYMIQVKGYA